MPLEVHGGAARRVAVTGREGADRPASGLMKAEARPFSRVRALLGSGRIFGFVNVSNGVSDVAERGTMTAVSGVIWGMPV